MLNPVDAEKVIRDGAAAGRYPDDIHEGVAWWVGACLVAVTQAARIAVAYDGRATSVTFHRRLCHGAVNAQHFACTVHDLHVAGEDELRVAMKDLGGVPGALVTTSIDNGGERVRIVLYGRDSQVLGEDAGLARIRRLITEDRVPRPVNDQARGRIEPYRRHRPEGAEQ
ncbi:hypothetical protein GCM10010218_63890 [Streptomyces mashuensis]|uniref:Alpha-D-phosphohexomutase alpha/beta/alpha domain-containing protein n=1 Tax=Streptomyces mashuensis TaxID=33904 RepID=A0A919B9V9_9ACTN|nr:hypothetical protein [Streptomyces mashuensis]GHF73994.1 hypothetical protein GCM10010218_63890 [Streptomyces mashuensis]